jgi:hypothetical protein
MKILREYRLLNSLLAGIEWMVRSPWRSCILIFLLSFAIRLNQLTHISSYFLIPNADREMGATAISLMLTGQFADPYLISTGPTAHLPPIYPLILSVIYRSFGLSTTAGTVSLLLIIVTVSLLYALLPWFSDQFGLGFQAGILGGLAGALLGEKEWPGHGEYLTGIVLGLLLVAFLRRWTTNHLTWHGSLLLGLAIGAAFHLQPALLPVMLGCMVFELFWGRSQQKGTFLSVTALGIVLACIPWAWRNYTTFHAFFFIRSNFGLELRMGNREGAAATMEVMDAQRAHRHPRINLNEARKLLEMGEIEYMRQAGQEALDWISAHPGVFLWLTVQRIANLWIGPLHKPFAIFPVLALTVLAFLGLWQTYPSLSIPQRAALIIPLATYPLVYYIVAYMPRYRIPIDWILFMLAGAAVWSWISRREWRMDMI